MPTGAADSSSDQEEQSAINFREREEEARKTESEGDKPW
jgi:hypothetical protein